MTVTIPPPVKRTETALYRRSGTILVAGACILLAGLLQVGIGAFLWFAGADLLPEALRVEEAESVLRTLGAIFAVFGVVALAVGVDVIRVRPWARYVAIAYGVLTILYVGALALSYRDPAVLLQPNLPALVTFLLLVPGVGDAFQEAAAERAAARAARESEPRRAARPAAR